MLSRNHCGTPDCRTQPFCPSARPAATRGAKRRGSTSVDSREVDASGRVLRTLETDGDQSTLETDGSEARGLLQSTSIYDEPPTDTYTMMLAPTPMVPPLPTMPGCCKY